MVHLKTPMVKLGFKSTYRNGSRPFMVLTLCAYWWKSWQEVTPIRSIYIELLIKCNGISNSHLLTSGGKKLSGKQIPF